jgi:hypothetical protein
MDVHNPNNRSSHIPGNDPRPNQTAKQQMNTMKTTRKPRLNTTARSVAKLSFVAAAAILIGINQTQASQTVRELFDKIGNSDYISIEGLAGGATSLGLQGTWSVYPKDGAILDTNSVYVPTGSTGIVYKDTWSLDWPLDNLQYGGVLLGHNGSQNGLLNFNSGGNLNTLTDTNTGLPYGNFTSKSYATRPLTPGAQINFQANGTYYFSVRVVKSYPWWVGDTAAGVGFSTGGETNSHFVGIGVTRTGLLDNEQVTPIGDSTYLSVGTLGQAGFVNHPDDSSGPYFPVARGVSGTWTNAAAGARTNNLGEFDGISAGLLVGRLTTTASGNSTLDVKAYLPMAPMYTNIVGGVTNVTLEQDINNITWEATHNFTETNVMTHLLVWMHGQNALEYDAIRVGTTYGDVVGFELIGAPVGSPSNTVYEGVNLTISQNVGINSGRIPMSFQWLSNGVPIVDATNATLVLASPTPSMTANYSVTVSNYYGGPVTSPETLITINPGVAPFFVQQPSPVAVTRYAGAPSAQFSVVVNGTPPFTYQWQHAGTNIGTATTTAIVSNTLMVAGPITAAQAGNYSVIVTNAYGSTNSAVATLTVVTPAANSYAAALFSLPTSPTNLFGYWRLNDVATTNNPTLNEYWNGNDGVVSIQDLTNGRIAPGVEGLVYPTFPAPQLAIALGLQGAGDKPFRADLKNLPSAQTNMTFLMWVKGGVRLMARNGYGQGYGLENQGGNAIRFYWGAYNATNGVTTAQWDTGLSASETDWSFVALVVEGTNASVYVGSTNGFTSAKSADIGGIPDTGNGGYMTLVNSTTLGESNLRVGVGRNPIPWADDGNGAPWTSSGGTWSDVAILYQVLTEEQIKGLFLTASSWIKGTPDGLGNLTLTWASGFRLQEASTLEGPWTDVEATSPYSTPISPGNKFYRTQLVISP